MKATFMSVAATLTAVLAPAPVAGQGQSDLEKKANAVRATAAEMNFTKIPWVTDVFDAFRLANDEKRPVFLYVVTGNPLDDC